MMRTSEIKLFNVVDELTSDLLIRQAGHWGIVEPIGAATISTADQLNKRLLKDFSKRPVVYMRWRDGWSCNIDGVEHQTKPSSLPQDTFKVMTEAIKTIGAQEGAPVTFIVERFDEATTNMQCELLKASRTVRERSRDVLLQLVIIGPWNRFELKRSWKSSPRFDGGSPPLDDKNIRCVDYLVTTECAQLLRDRHLVPEALTEEQVLCVDVIRSATGGDSELLAYACDRLNQGGPLSASNVERIVLDLHHQEAVIDIIRCRTSRLSSDAHNLLSNVTKYHFIQIHGDSITLRGLKLLSLVEELRLVGLVQLDNLEGGSIAVALRSETVGRILRESLKPYADEKYGEAISRGLLPVDNPVSLTACGLIMEIENTLRNFVYQAFGNVGGEHLWSQGVAKIIVSAGDGKKNQSLADAIEERRRQDQNSLLGGASACPETSLLTVGELGQIMTDEYQYNELFKKYFPKRHELQTFLEEFNSLRRRVAHNRLLSVTAVDRLRHMKSDLLKRISKKWEPQNIDAER